MKYVLISMNLSKVVDILEKKDPSVTGLFIFSLGKSQLWIPSLFIFAKCSIRTLPVSLNWAYIIFLIDC